ncbi:claudin-4-like [Callorhinchus milii]|uniref:claudin-4-like n=1 Tax=Callorhinchus milii TaxID=7868 RepID=UPI001C3F4E34|nr:claudin-4-like [Callorhinchus milii]
MASTGLQMLGCLTGIVGWLMGCVATAIPQWKVRTIDGVTVLTVAEGWEGIWMSCVNDSGGLLHCHVYDSLLALPSDLQAARVLLCLSVALGVLGMAFASVGMKCTRFARNEESFKSSLAVAAGVLFILSGFCVLVPASWIASNVVSDYYNPLVPHGLKAQLGDAVFLGWGAACLLVFGGAIMCCSCPQHQPQQRKRPYYSYHPALGPPATPANR